MTDNATVFVIFLIFLRFLRLKRRIAISNSYSMHSLNMFEEATVVNGTNSTSYYLSRRRRCHRRLVKETRKLMFTLSLVSCSPFQLTTNRHVWTRIRSRTWWENVVLLTWNDTDWVENFRMTRATFNFLCNQVRERINRLHTRLRSAITVEQRIAITLWRLSTNCDYRTIGHLFGVGRSTACEIFRETCQVICEELLNKVIRLPTHNEIQGIADGFEEKWGFPQAVGAIDGTHIPIIAPETNPIDFYNRKGFYSIILQAIVDDNYFFKNICVGWAGSVHDARVFANSSVYQKLEANSLFPCITTEISGIDVPYVLLGDPAYPLLRNLMKPFSDNGRLTANQHRFNKRLSSARMVVENAFGRLKGRWRCLLKRNDCNIDIIPTVVSACCVLHNLCEQHHNPFYEGWLDGVNDYEGPNVAGNIPDDGTGTVIRQALMEHFDNNVL